MFNLNSEDDKYNYRCAVNASEMNGSLEEAYNVSRNCLKYGGDKTKALEAIKEIAGRWME